MSRKALRRWIYEDTENEVRSWAEDMIKIGQLPRPPNGWNSLGNFPHYLEQYIHHLKSRR